MKGMVPPDKASKVSQQHYAVVYAPHRDRHRFSAASVEIVKDEVMAISQADPANKCYAAVVHGPSKSSEGLLLYYLLAWL